MGDSTAGSDDDDDDNDEGGDSSNRTVVGRCYGRPRDRHPARGPGVEHVEAAAGIRAGVPREAVKAAIREQDCGQ